jgi:hypothetical protein
MVTLCAYVPCVLLTFPLSPNIALGNVLTLSMCVGCWARDQVSHPCKTTGEIVLSCIGLL